MNQVPPSLSENRKVEKDREESMIDIMLAVFSKRVLAFVLEKALQISYNIFFPSP